MTWKLWKYMAYKSFLVKKIIMNIVCVIVQPIKIFKELTDNNKNVEIKFRAQKTTLF
jgi:hypothetical protein